MKLKINFKKAGYVLLILLASLTTFLGLLIYLAQKWMLKTWAHLTMEELVFQLTTSIRGTATEFYWDFAYSCAFPALALLLALLALFILLRRHRKLSLLLIVLCLGSGISLGSYSGEHVYEELDVKEYVEAQTKVTNFIEEHYADPAEVAITFPEKKRNLIHIFLESMESTYASTEAGGGFDGINYIPELTALANEEGNYNFSDKDTLGGPYTTVSTTFTSGGLFAQTSGLPLKTSAELGDMAYQESFFPSLTCLGDILENQGYKNYFLMGSDAAFGGRSNYFEEHGSYEMLDYYWAIREGKIPEGYYQWWGYEDNKLFEYAKEKLTELAASDEPFNFDLLTVGTHFEDGYTCELCDKSIEDSYGRSIACSSARIAELVAWIQEQSWYENTTVIISGDHLTMDSDFCDPVSEDYQRSVYNCFINSVATPVHEKNRVFTTLDMFPSILAAMGCTIEGERLGLGTNLFADKQTLAEEMTFEALNEELRPQSAFFTEREPDVVKNWYGTKWYHEEDDRYAVEEWVLWDVHQTWNDGDQFYYQGEDGKTVYGWQKIGNYWYYFEKGVNGIMKKGPLLQPDD